MSEILGMILIPVFAIAAAWMVMLSTWRYNRGDVRGYLYLKRRNYPGRHNLRGRHAFQVTIQPLRG